MAMRFAANVVSRSSSSINPRASLLCKYSTDGKGGGRVLSEEERAKETVYIQKMEKERMEKMKEKLEKEKAQKEKEGGGDKKSEGDSH